MPEAARYTLGDLQSNIERMLSNGIPAETIFEALKKTDFLRVLQYTIATAVNTEASVR